MSKTAVITGATSGIGAAYARRLAKDGYDLIITGRRKEVIQQFADELTNKYNVKVKVILADLSLDNDIQKVVEAIKSLENLDILINNAGYNDVPEFFDKTDLAVHEVMMKVLMTAPVRLTYAVLPGMTKSGRGTIINLSSLAGLLPPKKSSIYGASKSFVKQFSEGLHLELRNKGIKVQAVCPGFIDTDFYRNWSADTKKKMDQFKRMTPESVVECSMKDLEKNRPVCIPGLSYKFLGALFTIMPKSYVYNKVDKMIG